MPSWGWKETVPRREPRRSGQSGSHYAAVDTVLARLIGIEPLEIGCIASAIERDLFNPADVRTVGDDPAALAVPGFRKPYAYAGARGGVGRRVSLALLGRFGRIYAPRPGVISGACIGWPEVPFGSARCMRSPSQKAERRSTSHGASGATAATRCVPNMPSPYQGVSPGGSLPPFRLRSRPDNL